MRWLLCFFRARGAADRITYDSAMAEAARQSERLGTAIVPVFTRPPALIAMSAMTVQQLCGGRFVLGMGISSPQIIGQWMGVPSQLPVFVVIVVAVWLLVHQTTLGRSWRAIGFNPEGARFAGLPSRG